MDRPPDIRVISVAGGELSIADRLKLARQNCWHLPHNPPNSWLSYHTLVEFLLLVANSFLLLKSSTNLALLLIGDETLLADYNGAPLISDLFRNLFIIVNLLFLLSSLLGLASLLLASSPDSRRRLLGIFVVSQIALVILLVFLMNWLWFAPFKLNLNATSWRHQMEHYNYTSQVAPIDQIQRALGCCGYLSAQEWQQWSPLGLIAPSCCQEPARLELPGGGVSFCGFPWSDEEKLAAGCQRRLNERQVYFVFKLRLRLLLLLALALLNLAARSLVDRRPPKVDRRPLVEEQLPPSYEQVVCQAPRLSMSNEIRLVGAIRSAAAPYGLRLGHGPAVLTIL